MVSKYTYPRVTVSATANQHSSVQPPVPDTTIMFVPIVTKKGPNSIITPIHGLSEFISIFGDLDYETNGQMALNLYNWLRNGGTAYVYRLAGELYGKESGGQVKASIMSASATDEWEAKPTDVAAITEKWTLTDLDDLTIRNTYFIEKNNSSILYKNSNGLVDKVYTKKTIDDSDLETPADDNYYFIANGIEKEITENSPAVVTDEPNNAEVPSTTKVKKIVPFLESVANKTDGKKYFKDCLFIVNSDNNFGDATVIRYTEKKEKESSNNNDGPFGSAKYFGEYYENYEIDIDIMQKPDVSKNKKLIFTITVYENVGNTRLKVESFPRRTIDNYKNSILSSEYIGSDFDITTILEAITSESEVTSIKLKFNGADDKGYTTDFDCLEAFWQEEASKVLGNPLETPIDIIFDAGYDLSIKNQMMSFINKDSGQRPDIIGIFDLCSLGKKSTSTSEKIGYLEKPTEYVDTDFAYGVSTNIAIYAQYYLISDEIFTSQQIYVTPTYFLTKLIAYNDINYGIQFATAGIRRGILDDAEAIYKNPTADEKQDYFVNRINYAEKTPREYAFMNQRTHDNSSEESYTALSFLNNVRVVEKMKKEIERLGRNYLFEFNDSITLSQLSSVLNKYVMTWIANRTLASGIVTVSKNPWSDEAVDVTLTIRFNGTIEVISVEITIE